MPKLTEERINLIASWHEFASEYLYPNNYEVYYAVRNKEEHSFDWEEDRNGKSTLLIFLHLEKLLSVVELGQDHIVLLNDHFGAPNNLAICNLAQSICQDWEDYRNKPLPIRFVFKPYTPPNWESLKGRSLP